MVNTLYLPEIREMLAEEDVSGLREFCTALHAARIADYMEGLTPSESWDVLHAADLDTRVQIFGFFNDSLKIQLIESSDAEQVGALLASLPADDRVDLMKGVDPTVAERMLPLIPLAQRRELLRLSEYPEGTAGAVMTTEVARFPETLTVREVLEGIGADAPQLETVYYIYLVDDENHLRGLVSARQLVAHLRQPHTVVAEIMERDLVTVLATDDQELVAEKMADYDFLAIPVVDGEQHLLGIITHDDIIDVLLEEAEEDAYLAGAINPLRTTYLETPWYTLAWKRGTWLFLLSLAALFTVVVLEHYEGTLERITWLAFFIPLIISCGGNSGGQSATLVITALSSGDLTLKDYRAVICREIVMGLCLGAFLAAIGYGYAYFLVDGPSPVEKLVVPTTLMLVVLAGTICGGAMPLLFHRLGLDPVLMSHPFVTGIIDIAGIVIMMLIAGLMLSP